MPLRAISPKRYAWPAARTVSVGQHCAKRLLICGAQPPTQDYHPSRSKTSWSPGEARSQPLGHKLRVVADTSSLVRAALDPVSAPGRLILRLLEDEGGDVVTSADRAASPRSRRSLYG